MRDRFLVPAFGHHRLELDEPGPGVIGATALVGQEELDRLAEPAGNVLKSGQRGARAARFDQVDRRGCNAALANLGEAEAGLHAGLLDRPGPEIYSRQTPMPGTPSRAVPVGNGHSPAVTGLNHAGSLTEIT
jgi:hypothetical protein